MTDEQKIKLMEAWDEMDNAAQRILTAQPFQMTEASSRLDAARQSMRTAVHAAFLRQAP